MDVTEWSYREFPGKLPDAQPGYFLGYDEDDQPYILKMEHAQRRVMDGGYARRNAGRRRADRACAGA